MRQPWLPQWEEDVNKNIIQKDIDVLHLTEIWTDSEANKILNRKDVKLTYPYHYRPKKRNTGTCGCNHNPYFDALGREFLNCVIETGTNPREIIQPSNGSVSLSCYSSAIKMVLLDTSNTTNGFLCLACVINSAQNYISNKFDVNEIMDQCNNNSGPLYAYDGESAHLILSKYPLKDIEEEYAYAWLSNRVNIYATIDINSENFKPIRIGFGHFAFNLLQDINNTYTNYMYGYTQKEQAIQMVNKNPDVIIGDLNTGDNYQPDGYKLLLEDYISTFSNTTNTYCPPDRTFEMCVGIAPQAIDHVLVKRKSKVYFDRAKLFNKNPMVSDHIGVKCAIYSYY
jgi:endonuclease/exonuclease/phosphatase family metal-dependent hydrolase